MVQIPEEQKIVTRPLLSIVMPVYNGERYLQEAIDSLLAQTFTDFELIIVDDGSTDSTTQILEKQWDNRVITVINKKNEGIVQSRNTGLAAAKGKYYAPFDADDIAHPEKFQRQIAFLEAFPDYSMVGSYSYRIDASGHPLSPAIVLPANKAIIPANLLFRNYFIQSSIVARRDLMPERGYAQGFEIGEDWLMWHALAKKGKIGNIKEFLVSKREHAQNSGSHDVSRLYHYDRNVFTYLYSEAGILLTEAQKDILMSIKYGLPPIGHSEIKTAKELFHQMLDQANSRWNHIDRDALAPVLANRWIKLVTISRIPVFGKIACLCNRTFLRFLFLKPIQTFRQ